MGTEGTSCIHNRLSYSPRSGAREDPKARRLRSGMVRRRKPLPVSRHPQIRKIIRQPDLLIVQRNQLLPSWRVVPSLLFLRPQIHTTLQDTRRLRSGITRRRKPSRRPQIRTIIRRPDLLIVRRTKPKVAHNLPGHSFVEGGAPLGWNSLQVQRGPLHHLPGQ